MNKCIFCLEEKEKLTKEHIIYDALGGSNVYLEESSCNDCQKQCNESFEHSFLKGANFVSLMRANLGLRSSKYKREAPIFGLKNHGVVITVPIETDFPPIQIVLFEGGKSYAPMQVIFLDENRQPIDYYCLENSIPVPIHFDGFIKRRPQKARYAALWANSRCLSSEDWQILSNAFIEWTNIKQLSPITLSVPSQAATGTFELLWNTEEQKRFIVKIGFMYALSIMEKENRYSPLLDRFRGYILYGEKITVDFWRHAPVLQWNGIPPGSGVLGEQKFTYLLATVIHNNALYSIIKLHNLGVFAIKLLDAPLASNSLTTYLLQKNEKGKCSLIVTEFVRDEANEFAEAFGKAGQL